MTSERSTAGAGPTAHGPVSGEWALGVGPGTWAVAWSRDGRLAVTALGSVLVWDRPSAYRQPDHVLDEASSAVVSAAWDPNGRLAAGTYEGTVLVWGSDGRLIRRRQVESSISSSQDHPVRSVAWDSVGRLAAATETGKFVIIWDQAVETPPLRVLAAGGGVSSLAWAVTGRLAAGTNDGRVLVWDRPLTSAVAELITPSGSAGVSAVGWDARGRLAAGTRDGQILIWENPSSTRSTPAARLKVSSSSWVYAVAWDGDGRLAAAGPTGGLVWDRPTTDATPNMTMPAATAYARLAWGPRGELAITTRDHRVLVHDRRDASTDPNHVLLDSGPVESVAWGPRGDLAAGTGDAVLVWDRTNASSPLLRLHAEQGVASIAWSPHGWLAAGTRNGRLLLWAHPLVGGDPVRVVAISSEPVYVAWDRTGRLAAAADRLLVWRDPTSDGEPSARRVFNDARGRSGPNQHAWCLAWGPSGQLAVGTWGGVLVWEDPVHENLPTQRLPTHGPVSSVAWNAENRLAAAQSEVSAIPHGDPTSGIKSTVLVWDRQESPDMFGRPEILGHPQLETGHCLSVAWGPLGLLAVGNVEGVLLYEHPTADTEPQRVLPISWGATSLAWNPDGRLAIGTVGSFTHILHPSLTTITGGPVQRLHRLPPGRDGRRAGPA